MTDREWLKNQGLYKLRELVHMTALTVGVFSLIGAVVELIFGVRLSELLPVPGKIEFEWIHVPVVAGLLSFLFSTHHFYGYFIDDIEASNRSLVLSLFLFVCHLATFIVAFLYVAYWLFAVVAVLLVIVGKNFDIRRLLHRNIGHPMSDYADDWLSRAWKHLFMATALSVVVYFTTQDLRLVSWLFELEISANAALFYRDLFFTLVSIQLIADTQKRSHRIEKFKKEDMENYKARVKDYCNSKTKP